MNSGQIIGLAGGILGGGLIGLAGGIVGLYFSIKRTNGPRERAFMILVGAGCCAFIILFLGLTYILPSPYRYILWLPYTILLLFCVIIGNKAQMKIRKKEALKDKPSPVAVETKEDHFAVLIDRLRADGLVDEAAELDILLRHMAWTTGTEFLGEFGLAMKKMRRTVRRKAGAETKAAFEEAARAVKKAWPHMFWW